MIFPFPITIITITLPTARACVVSWLAARLQLPRPPRRSPALLTPASVLISSFAPSPWHQISSPPGHHSHHNHTLDHPSNLATPLVLLPPASLTFPLPASLSPPSFAFGPRSLHSTDPNRPPHIAHPSGLDLVFQQNRNSFHSIPFTLSPPFPPLYPTCDVYLLFSSSPRLVLSPLYKLLT